ncbi:MAG: NAD-glutamate dehydrogenase [Hyphomicrobiales bacterium]|nr:NAD-glutamate dehydrogenase [Hyphomicrobiales bacterium]
MAEMLKRKQERPVAHIVAPEAARVHLASGFETTLFSRTDPEDLARLDGQSRAAIAASALAVLAEPRPRGKARIALRDVVVDDSGMDKVTIVEAINDNMPFLLDSTLAEIAEHGLTLRLVAHPILSVDRDAAGALVELKGEAQAQLQPGERRESFIHLHLDPVEDSALRGELIAGLERVHAEVRRAVSDFPSMRARVFEAVQAAKISPPPLAAQDVAEAIAIVEWMLADNFTFLGVREYRFVDDDQNGDLVGTNGLGLLRDPDLKVLRQGKEFVNVTPEVRTFLAEPTPVIVTKANIKSRVHRRVHMDYVGLKLYSPEGVCQGELRIVGLFTANAYDSPVAAVPYLRRKAEAVLARAALDPSSYAGRALKNVLEIYPRDELFQIDVETLYHFVSEILTLSERPRIRALARLDRFNRFVSILVFIPKDRYDSAIRQKVGAFLAHLYAGRLSAAYPAYPDGPLARTHFIVGRDGGETPDVPRASLEAGIAAIVRNWVDELRSATIGLTPDHPGAGALERYLEAFGPAYRAAYGAEAALNDIAIVEGLGEEGARAVRLIPHVGDDYLASLKLYTRGRSVSLSQRVPILENFGFEVIDESSYTIAPAGGRPVFLHDMTVRRADGAEIEARALAPRLEEALIALGEGNTESDSFDALVPSAGLAWRDVALVRALSRYLQQATIRYTQGYMAQALVRHAEIAAALVTLFYARFNPELEEERRAQAEAATRDVITEKLKEVTSLDDDRILSRYLNLIDAMVRTNFFQRDAGGHRREAMAFKFESDKIEGLPLPHPLFEVFVYSPRVEAVHLRFGRVARGGIRWSDRPQDFRTEVLGLVKAQQVKNAVIVPVGAKGGFFPKRLPPQTQRDAWLAEGTQSYKLFISTLLDITDNIDASGIVHPPATLFFDGDDPYLVVAADKGTATFSDTANAISEAKHHWLGDAFASGGSQGYDHKKMGITARGAWEAVKRHFREIDIDIQTTPFTVCGVGDMSGDVFGNGMLLSPHIRLVAAFDHRDIFLDPTPETERAFAERKRLFDLPRSSWKDYDTSIISAGGGVYSRSLKAIPLSPQMREVLDLDKREATPFEVITAILKARVDLLWFGGIGTYVRSAHESDAEVGDRANDAIRIIGSQVRAKVIGEGANLGVTQRGRIEAARAGVRLNTDAIDNSAGVNTSDVEVNFKIALASAIRDERLTLAGRDTLLAEMTEDVAALVLRNNYLQSLALSLAERRGLEDVTFAAGLMRMLEAEGRLDRSVEFLPGDEALEERAKRGEGLTRPELSVLLAYAKLSLDDHLRASDVPDDPYFEGELTRYFPNAMRESFSDDIKGHRLRREIIATQLSNAVINRAGPTVAARLAGETGLDPALMTRAYAAVRDSFGLLELNTAIDALDGKLRGDAQLALYRNVQDVVLSQLAWFMRNARLTAGSLTETVATFRAGIGAVSAALDPSLGPAAAAARAARRAELVQIGAPEPLAHALADLASLSSAPDIVVIAGTSGKPIDAVAMAHFGIDDMLGIGALVAAAGRMPLADAYDRLARDRAVATIGAAHRGITAKIVALHASEEAPGSALDAFLAADANVARARERLVLLAASPPSIARLTVAAGLLDDLAR